jgi:hypothetical protein
MMGQRARIMSMFLVLIFVVAGTWVLTYPSDSDPKEYQMCSLESWAV